MARRYLELSNILQKLLYQKRMNPSELAREVDLPVPTIHRLVTGKSTRPYRSSLKPIADFFSISIEQLLGEQPLPHHKENQTTNVFPSTNRGIIEIPLFSWEELSQREQFNKRDNTIAAMDDLAQNCFAAIMNDSSMEPMFAKGSILIFDPNKEASDRSFVLIKLQDSDIYVFRQLIIDAEHQFIKPLNPDLIHSQMRLVDDDDELIAVLVEARHSYRNM